jgi:glycosidase
MARQIRRHLFRSTAAALAWTLMACGASQGPSPQPEPGSNSATVFYDLTSKGWSAASMKNDASGAFTASPAKMLDACAGWAKLTVDLGPRTAFQATFTDGGTQWDKTETTYYVINTGTSLVKAGAVTSGASDPCAGSGPGADTTPPSKPLHVSATASATTITVQWDPSSDDRGVTRYEITRAGGTHGPGILSSNGTSLSDANLEERTAYTYTVKAFDAAGNASPSSDPASATTGTLPNGPVPPTVSFSPDGGTFTSSSVSVTVTVNSSVTVSAMTYQIGTSAAVAFGASPTTISVPLSTTPVQVTVVATNSAGTTTLASQPYVQELPPAIRIYQKTTAAKPSIWLWEDGAPSATAHAVTAEEGYSFPGPDMLPDTTHPGWFYWEIPAKYYPLDQQLDMKFNGDSAHQYNLPAPVTASMWFDGTGWTDHNPDLPAKPTVTFSPDGGTFSTSTSSVQVTITVTANDTVTASTYQIGSGAAVPFTSPAAVTVPLSTTAVQLTVVATDSAGATTATSQAYVQSATPPPPAFSWSNATVYFAITDRFNNGDTSNDTSYGRVKVDASGYDVGTFHGGDLKGLLQKVNDGYFTNLGVNAIWFSEPYEQIHGWVGGGSLGRFAQYAYHGYYVLDYTNIDANFGTKDDLKAFVDAAHAKGIRVVMDVVVNHAGYNTLQDMSEFNFGGKTSDFHTDWTPASGGSANWFGYSSLIDYTNVTEWAKWWGQPWIRAGDNSGRFANYDVCGSSDTTLCTGFLPDFKTESGTAVTIPAFLQGKINHVSGGIPDSFGGAFSNYTYSTTATKSVSDWTTEWLAQYVREYGIDGFRVDTAKNVDTAILAKLKDKATPALAAWRANNPTAPGATWTDPFWDTGEVFPHGVSFDGTYYNSGKLDSLINFDLQGVISNVAASSFNSGSLGTLDSIYASYAGQLNTLNGTSSWNVLSYMDDHDKAPMFSAVAGGNADAQKRAGTALLLTPGGVQIYYGDEYGRAAGPFNAATDNSSNPAQDLVLRSDMDWNAVASQAGDANSTLAHWQKLGQFRNRHIAVGAGVHTRVSTSPYTFTRVWKTDKVAVVVGASGSVTVNVSSVFADGAQVRNFYDGTTATVSNGQVTFNAGSSGVILIEAAN